jgi:hypothetical protein
MRRKFVVLGFISLALLSIQSHASGDFGCGPPRGTIFLRAYESCNSVPFLSPANDSRLNLELLLIDAGKLTGTLNTPVEYSVVADPAWLLVPFNLEDWQVHERSLGQSTDHDNAKNTANSNNDYAQGEGSRCSKARDGMAAFENAVNAAVALLKDDAPILIAARSSLAPNCNAVANSDWEAPQGIRSALGREFAVYIAGASAFYAGDFPTALNSFKSLRNSANPWLKETSRYMVGRTLLNSAPLHAFGQWGEMKLDQVDKNDLKNAEDAFNSYLHDFPHGMYATSSRGLLRRVYWLSDDQTKLAEAFDRAFADSEKDANNVTLLELVQEADSKLIASIKIDRIQSPQFLAIVDLMRMRSADDQVAGAAANASLPLADLEGQKDRFASKPALYKYLLAVFHLYADSKPEQTLALLPNLTGAQLSYFDFSQQTLRVLALDAGKQYDAERKLLLQMLPMAKLPLQSEQLQLALAGLEERTGHLDRVFVPESPIHERAIRIILVEHTASAEILRQRIKDRKENAEVIDAALYTLLYKELTGGKYQSFQADLALMQPHPSEFLAPFADSGESKGPEYRCPSLREVASTLQRDGSDARSLNCVGELVRLHGVHFGQDATPPKTDLGGSGSLFPVTNFSRMDGYLQVIANKQAPGDARAYALFRAVNCYARSGYSDCGSQDIPLSTRKQWFQVLHKEYPDSTWAKSSKYYW